MDVRVIDYTGEQVNPPKNPRGEFNTKLNRQGKAFVRKPEDVDMLVIHQTACVFGPTDKRRPETRYPRAKGVRCHALAFRDGVAAIVNPVEWNVSHGNGFNARSLGLEVEGHFSGLPDDPRTPRREDLASVWGGNATPYTPEGHEAAKACIRILLARAKIWGANIRYVTAHRQSSGTRQSDPGWEVWRKLALGFCVAELGLETIPTLTMVSKTSGPGRPIPEAWQADQVGVRY